MPGPTTEILNDDVRALRDELHRIDLDVRELNTQTRGITSAIRLLAVFALTCLLSSVWWGASLGTKVDGQADRFRMIESQIDKLDGRMDKLDARMDKLDGRIDKLEVRIERLDASINARLDRIEAAIVKQAAPPQAASPPR